VNAEAKWKIVTVLHAIAPAVLPIGAVPCNCRVALAIMQLMFCWPRDEKRVDFSARARSIEKPVKEQLELRRSHSSRIPSTQSSEFTSGCMGLDHRAPVLLGMLSQWLTCRETQITVSLIGSAPNGVGLKRGNEAQIGGFRWISDIAHSHLQTRLTSRMMCKLLRTR
jgi:hypothetical protein